MIILAGNGGGPGFREAVCQDAGLGIMLSPGHDLAWCPNFACDNGAFAHRDDPGYWERGGETAWLKMLDRVTEYRPRPLFVALPDVVYDWPATLDRSLRYLPELETRTLRPALVLQDGAQRDLTHLLSLRLDCWFVGGSRRWKWENLPALREWSWGDWLHVGRCNGWRQLQWCEELGVDSVDGTSFNRFWDSRRGGKAMLTKARAPRGPQKVLTF